MKVILLTSSQVTLINEQIMHTFQQNHGVRDPNLLESALHGAFYPGEPPFAHGSMVTVAATLCEKIIQNHPFLDGNKRTALIAAELLLELNGLTLSYSEHPVDEAVQAMEGVASHRMSLDELKEWFLQRVS